MAMECLAWCVLDAGKASVVREPHSILPAGIYQGPLHICLVDHEGVDDSHSWHHHPFFPLRTGQATSWMSPPSWAISWQSRPAAVPAFGVKFPASQVPA